MLKKWNSKLEGVINQM